MTPQTKKIGIIVLILLAIAAVYYFFFRDKWKEYVNMFPEGTTLLEQKPSKTLAEDKAYADSIKASCFTVSESHKQTFFYSGVPTLKPNGSNGFVTTYVKK